MTRFLEKFVSNKNNNKNNKVILKNASAILARVQKVDECRLDESRHNI